jgi:two-component system nitrate/nitrite response regulator NarL
MGSRVGTIIIEPRSLVREALAALLGNLSYRVVCSAESAADIIGASTIADAPKLIILGALSAEDAAEQAINVRRLWPDSKIMLLFEATSSADLQKLLISQIDGFVPLFASADTLSSMLDLIITQDFRVMIASDAKHSTVMRVRPEELQSREGAADKCLPSAVGDEAISVAADALLHTASQANAAGSGDATAVYGVVKRVSPVRKLRLSEREAQILDGLVKGHANKVIARTFDISEATVKVHIKSILRKIRVANRTQAAIWALENGYCSDEVGTTLRVDDALARPMLR